MKMPGFTAEASIYRSTAQYAMGPRDRNGSEQIVPHVTCGPCKCPSSYSCCILSEGGWCHCGCDSMLAADR